MTAHDLIHIAIDVADAIAACRRHLFTRLIFQMEMRVQSI